MIGLIKKCIAFLDAAWGTKFIVWRYILLLGFFVYMAASLSGAFKGWSEGGMKSGPFVIFKMFAVCSFTLFIPFGYLFENFKRVVAMKYVGWIYFLFFCGMVFLLILLPYNFFVKGDMDFIDGLIRMLLLISFYSMLSVPLSVVYFLFGKR